ncbi:MAG: hypothetical protein K2L51_07820 [Clostridiales bacterium]|nr:hypothetical protein [Clostridiales bacterium]
MHIHNTYTITDARGTVRAHNALAADFWQKAAEHTRWAAYFALTDEEGASTFVAARLIFLQCDPSRGGTLYAKYTAEAECAQGRRLCAVSLCYAAQEGAQMSTAQIAYTGAGEEIAIAAVIGLEAELAENVCFCEGDNALVRRLLGCGEETDWRLGWGECAYPARVCTRTEELITEVLPARVAADENGFTFTSAGETGGCELLLYAGEKAALRALRPVTYRVKSQYETVPAQNALLISNRPQSVYGVRLNDASLLQTDTCRVCERAAAVKKDYIRDLGAAGEVFADPAGEYAAFTTASYVEVYKADVLDLTLMLRVPRTTEHVFMCRGGALGLWSASELTIYEPNDEGEYDSFTVSVPSGNACLLVREGMRYHAAYRRTSAVYRLEITREGAKQLSLGRITSALFLLGRCGDAILIADKTLSVQRLDVDVSADFACSELSGRTATRVMSGVGDCFAVTRESGKTYVYDTVHNAVFEAEDGLCANGRLLYNTHAAYIYDYYHGVRKIEGDYDMSDATGACLAGDGLLVVRGGKLYIYYLSGTDIALRLPAGSAGKSAFYTVRESVLTGVGQPAAFALRP